MLQAIQVTLYDVFGYLLPGFVFLAAILVAFWAWCFPTVPMPWPLVLKVNWLVVAVPAYTAGHLAHALANLINKLARCHGAKSAEDLVLAKPDSESEFPCGLIELAKSKASPIVGVAVGDIKPRLLYRFCDEVVAENKASRDDRDLYIHREGFYRGLYVSLLALALAVLTRGLKAGAALGTDKLPIPATAFWFLGVLCVLAAIFSYQRSMRFGGYRVRQAVLGFLLLQAKAAEGKQKA